MFRALLIGNSTFPEDPHNLHELVGPVNDLVILYNALTDPIVGLFARENVRLLPERSKREVSVAMGDFFRESANDDQLLLYYSGHGKVDLSDNFYLCAHDTRSDKLLETGIWDREIDGMMGAAAARAILLILDCCYSGNFKGGASLPNGLRGEGRFVLTSSRRGHLSDDASDPNGTSAFTRHLTEGLLLGTLDANNDGYVTVNELYDYVLPKVRAETKQIPQRHFDRTVGDIPVARSRPALPSSPPRHQVTPAERSGAIEVSESDITISGVEPDEVLAPEIVDVYRSGGGTLEWTAETDAEWISLEPEASFLRLTFHPVPGRWNRGKVYVRDTAGGTRKTIRVNVHVLDQERAPRLVLSGTDLDFGLLRRGEPSPRRTIQLFNTGSGDLNARPATSDRRIQLDQSGQAISVFLDTSTVGQIDGEVIVPSSGGEGRIRVRASIVTGPVLGVEPLSVDFGITPITSRPMKRILITNQGDGTLSWEVGGKRGHFFSVERSSDGLILRVEGQPGDHLGAISITSNGGATTLDVRALIVPEPMEPTPSPKTVSPARPATPERGSPSGPRFREPSSADDAPTPGGRATRPVALKGVSPQTRRRRIGAAALAVILLAVTIVLVERRRGESTDIADRTVTSVTGSTSTTATSTTVGPPSAPPRPLPSSGPLAAGRYTTQTFLPTVTFSIGDGWSIDDAPSPERVVLSRREPTETVTLLRVQRVYDSQQRLSTREDALNAVQDVRDLSRGLADWLLAHPQRKGSSTIIPTTAGGIVGKRIDAQFAPYDYAGCGTPDNKCVPLFQLYGADGQTFAFARVPTERIRFDVFDVQDAKVVVAASSLEGRFEAFTRELPFSIEKIDPTDHLSALRAQTTPNPSVGKEPVALTADVGGMCTAGRVTFSEVLAFPEPKRPLGSAAIVNGRATLDHPLTFDTRGQDRIVAEYEGPDCPRSISAPVVHRAT